MFDRETRQAMALMRERNYYRDLCADLLDALEGVMAPVAGCEREPRYETARAVITRAKTGNVGDRTV
jgi:hypothetical protein